MIYAIGTAILAAAFAALYLLDRGLANTLEALAIRLLRMADRLRERRAAVQDEQGQWLNEHVNGKSAEPSTELAMGAAQ